MKTYIKTFEEFDLDDIFASDAASYIMTTFQPILDHGFTETTTVRQKKNGTRMFDSDPANYNRGFAYTLFPNGYVRVLAKANVVTLRDGKLDQRWAVIEKFEENESGQITNDQVNRAVRHIELQKSKGKL